MELHLAPGGRKTDEQRKIDRLKKPKTTQTLHLDRKEGNSLFNDALNTFYLRLYGISHMVKDHSDSVRETCCCHMGYSFRLAARVHPTDRMAHTTAFVTPVVEHWQEQSFGQSR